MFEISVLGELVLKLHGERVRLRHMECVVVLALFTAPEYTLSVTRLTGRLWAGDSTEGSELTTRSHVSHILTRAPGLIGKDPAPRGRVGYRLNVARRDIDAARFETQVSSGCQRLRQGLLTEAATTLDDALGLWRDVPLKEAERRPFAKAERNRLDNLHRAARLARLDAWLALGWDWGVDSELAQMTAAWSGDYRIWYRRAVNLYSNGRDAEAVAVCKEAIEAFHHQGVDTGALEKLQCDILNGALPR